MASNVAISNAKIHRVKFVQTKGGGLLSILFQWWERDRDEFLASFGNLTIFRPGNLTLNVGDKVNLKNMKLKVTESDAWVQVKKDDRLDESVEAVPARFPDFSMFAQDKEGNANVEIVARGEAPQKKRAPKTSGDDLPF